MGHSAREDELSWEAGDDLRFRALLQPEHLCSVCTQNTLRAGWNHHVFNIFLGKLAYVVAKTLILCGLCVFFFNSLKYAKHIHLSINMAVKSVMPVMEEELFSVLAPLSLCNGFWLHASPKPCVVLSGVTSPHQSEMLSE